MKNVLIVRLLWMGSACHKYEDMNAFCLSVPRGIKNVGPTHPCESDSWWWLFLGRFFYFIVSCGGCPLTNVRFILIVAEEGMQLTSPFFVAYHNYFSLFSLAVFFADVFLLLLGVPFFFLGVSRASEGFAGGRIAGSSVMTPARSFVFKCELG